LHQAKWVAADVFKYLRECRAKAEQFDLIVLDPPKFAPNAASVERACRAYKDINLLAMQLLKPGGDLLTFSCSGAVSSDLFRKVIAGAAADAGTPLHVQSHLAAGDDHPVLLQFPEGEYLKGLHLRRC
jgi:23S rRNA (cytosine1962-C5)-methyltransferase